MTRAQSRRVAATRRSRPSLAAGPPDAAAPRNSAARHDKRKRSPARESGEPANPRRKQDLAFQQAMMRAAASGKENPPMIGIFKDARPLDAPRLFEPVPYSSGCTSPARECADVVAVDGVMAPVVALTPPILSRRLPGEMDP